MITWNFSLDNQPKYYLDNKKYLFNGFYQDTNLYVLPFMPLKFRSRVVYLPESCNHQLMHIKHSSRLTKLSKEFQTKLPEFEKSLNKLFPGFNKIEIVISPSFYGTVGRYDLLSKNKILVRPRYDRNLNAIFMLVVNSLTHYYFFGIEPIDKYNELWVEKQKLSKKYQEKVFGNLKNRNLRPMIKIISNSYSADLAIKSKAYLNSLGINTQKTYTTPITKLTKNEAKIYQLLKDNKERVTMFEEIANTIWAEKSYEKYSEYAITKLMNRLKNKLPEFSIHVQKNSGYFLY